MKRFGRFGSKFDRWDNLHDYWYDYGHPRSKEYKKDCNRIIRRSERLHIKEELQDCNE